jgi:hypothetical protein
MIKESMIEASNTTVNKDMLNDAVNNDMGKDFFSPND